MNFLLFFTLLSITTFWSVWAGESWAESESENEIIPVIPVNLQNILTEEVGEWEAPEYMMEKYPYYMSGFDEDDRPIWICEFGSWDLRKIIEGGGQGLADFNKYVDAALFRVLNSTRLRSTTDNPIRHAVLIIDMDHYSLTQINSVPTVSFILKRFRQFIDVAENLHVAHALNVNFIAHGMLNLIRPILGRHFHKIHAHGTNRAKWLPRLLSELPRDQLPKWYGGSLDIDSLQVYG